ncbi:Uncharacterised protein [Vibrio cholerae]|nr:Uncharacterised protein [Vibrio cholerae]
MLCLTVYLDSITAELLMAIRITDSWLFHTMAD